MAKVHIEGVTKTYGNTQVLHDINLSIEHGEFVVFVGPSGSGKSTLLRVIGGLERISEGNIFIDGLLVNDLDASDRNLSMVFQSYALYPHLNVWDNLAFPMRMAKSSKSHIDLRIKAVSEMLQIEHLLDRKPKQLSGGQRQRVAIGRAVVREPKVFLFDEPLSNLDAELRVQMRVQIAKLHRVLGNTMIYVTHDQVEAMTMADKIVVLQDGKIEQIGTPHELYHRPQSKFVAGFIGSPRMNFLDATCASISNGVEVYFGGANSAFIPVSPNGLHNGQKVSLGIRPDDFTAPIPGLDQLRVEIEVEYVENLGSATYIYGKAGHESLVARAPASGNFSINSGTVSLSVSTRDCYLFDANGQACPRREVPNPWDKVK